MTRFVVGSLLLGSLGVSAVSAQSGDRATPSTIPLCPGLTIVTAVSQSNGDYESIKTIESISTDAVRLKYSSERLVEDLWSNDPPKLQRLSLHRSLRREDLVSAKLYLQQFSPELPELVPETTAVGTSTAVLRTLKKAGVAEMGIFIAFSQTKPSIDRSVHPNVYDNQMVAKVQRVGRVMVPVIVNDARVGLPAIHASGDFFGDKSEFFFLDDEANPIALRFRIGIDAFRDGGGGLGQMFAQASGKKVPPDRDTLQVIKISFRCTAPLSSAMGGGGETPGSGRGGGIPAGGGGEGSLEEALEKTRRAEVYDIFFTFNSDQIREESKPTLDEIAGLLTKHADWNLNIEGHTDNVASDAFNLDLSRRRAAAVRDVLVKRYRVDPGRLATSGFGESRPKDTNDTLEGRARNRRVELVRLP